MPIMHNLEEKDKFGETYNLPRPNHEEVTNVNRIVPTEDMQAGIKNLQHRRAQDQMASPKNSTKHFQEN